MQMLVKEGQLDKEFFFAKIADGVLDVLRINSSYYRGSKVCILERYFDKIYSWNILSDKLIG